MQIRFWRKPKPFEDVRMTLTGNEEGELVLSKLPDVTPEEEAEFLAFVERHTKLFEERRKANGNSGN